MNATLQTERLLLRLCTVDDLDLFKSTWGDAEVMQTFGHGRAHLAPEGRHVYRIWGIPNTQSPRGATCV